MKHNEITLNTEQLRKLQLEELDILIEVDRICRKHKIQYSMNGGTMLGAVRHKGFIPWDDDVDVSMLRHDYHRFCSVCKKELDTERFFLQTWDTDGEYRCQYGRMRKNGTKYIRSGHEDAKHHNGINIDIFPRDNMPQNLLFCAIFRWGCFLFRKILYSPTGMLRSKRFLEKELYRRLSAFDRNKVVNAFKRWLIVFSRLKSNRVDAVGFAYRYKLKDMKKLGWDNYMEQFRGMRMEWVNDLKEYEFEGRCFYGPADYDGYLTAIYGDYMTLPPVDERKGDHSAVEIQFS